MKFRSHRQSKSSFSLWGGLSSIAIAGLMTPAAIVVPVQAAVLNDWTFDADAQQLILTLPDGITPDYFLLAEPARIVLDLPNTRLGTIAAEQQYTGAIRSIRFSEIQGGSRVVIEFAPNTLLDPRHAELTSQDAGNGRTQWTLQPLIQDATPAAPVAATEPGSSSTPAEASSSVSTPVEATTESESMTVEAATVPQLPAASSAIEEPDAEASNSAAAEADDTNAESVDSPAVPQLPANSTVSDSFVSEAPIPEDAAQTPIPIEVSPPPDISTAPQVVRPATEGAAQVLSDASDSFRGVRTDAAALAGVDSVLSSEQLPTDPFASAGQSSASAPPTAEETRGSSPQVSVPSLADVPEAPSSPASPPSSSNEIIGENPAIPAPEAEREAGAIAVNPIQVSPPPQAPETWAAPPASSPDSVPPPQSDAIAIAPEAPPTAATSRPPAEIPTNAAQPAPPSSQAVENASVPPNTAVATPLDSEPLDSSGTLPPPSLPEERPPVPVSPPPLPESPAAEDVVPPPPFLASVGETPEVEQPTIPPPPSLAENDNTVPFGAPLPLQSKVIEDESTPTGPVSTETIPVGTRLVLQYTGAESVTLSEQEPWYEVLIVAEDVFHPDTQERLLTKGTSVVGYFEGFDESGRRFVAQISVEGGDRQPLLAESAWLAGSPQPSNNSLLTGTGVGAAAVAVLSGFSGFGLIGGAVLGAASALATSPRLVTIEPGQLIEVEVVSETQSFHDHLDATSPTP